YPLVSGDAGGSAWATEWNIDGFPTMLLIKPDRSIIEMTRPFSYEEVVANGGTASSCADNWPTADFYAERTIIPAGESIIFHDQSTGAAEWNWTFFNGSPSSSNSQIPEPITYERPGDYNVRLTIRNNFGNEASTTKERYIHVVEPATEPPTAYFAANQVTVIAGNSINFTDLSQGNPYIWKWWFENAQPNSSTEQHPQNIRYNNVGNFNVTLIVENTLGRDTLVLENYIHVIPTIGSEVPKPKFTCDNRLVRVNTPVYFNDESTGYPMQWYWEFQGGNPATSSFQNVIDGVVYENSGVYDVTLSVSNPNGGKVLEKEDYIVVYENYVGSYCDTLCNLQEDEVAVKLGTDQLTSGYIGGHNSDGVTTYADKFEYYTFNEVSAIVVPIMRLRYTNDNEYITFYTWDGSDPVPTTVLSEQRVYLRDLRQNYYQIIEFATPLRIDGPFYLGYTLNYANGTEVVFGMASDRGYGNLNTMYVHKDGEWKSVSDAYDNVSTSSGMRVYSCLVGVEDVEFSTKVSLFPNPCSNQFNIQNEYGFEKNDFVEIFDNLGRMVYSNYSPTGTMLEINTTNFANGTYITRIFTQGKIAVQKFEKLD
ncbi:MAG: PKD domain-containing protein, partial [Bacteroidales bacterium]|nr:PKD domain-containing protein [Bacteroidales bacterium]